MWRRWGEPFFGKREAVMRVCSFSRVSLVDSMVWMVEETKEPHPDLREVNISLDLGLVVVEVVEVSVVVVVLVVPWDESKFFATASLVNSNADAKLFDKFRAAALAVACAASISTPPVGCSPSELFGCFLVLSCFTWAVTRCVTASPVRSREVMRRSLNVDVSAKN